MAVKEIREGYIAIHDDTPRVPPSVVQRLSYFMLRQGDVVFARKGGVERCAVVRDDREAMLGSDAIRLRLPEEVRPGFMAHALQTKAHRRWMVVHATGSIMSGLNQQVVARIPVLLPPRPEQHRIAEILDTLDGAIRKTEQVIAKLQQMKQGLLHDLLTRGIDDNGELRDPVRHPEQFKDSPLGRIPRGWDASTVDSEFDIAAGMTLGPHRRPAANPFPYLRVANVFKGRLDLRDVAFIEARPSEVVGRTLVEGDLLVVEGHANPEEIGRCAMATRSVRGFTFQNHLFRLRPRRATHGYGLLWMNGDVVRSYWRRVCSTSSGLNTINRTKLRAVPMAVPSQAEQRRIQSALEQAVSRLRAEGEEVAKLRTLKQGLMDDLLTGRVRVQVSEGAA